MEQSVIAASGFGSQSTAAVAFTVICKSAMNLPIEVRRAQMVGTSFQLGIGEAPTVRLIATIGMLGGVEVGCVTDDMKPGDDPIVVFDELTQSTGKVPIDICVTRIVQASTTGEHRGAVDSINESLRVGAMVADEPNTAAHRLGDILDEQNAGGES